MIDDSQARSNLYKLLSHLFLKEPDERFLKEFKDMQQPLSSFGFDIDVITGHGRLAEDLAVEYATLFIGPIEHLAPYESAYREATLYGNPAVDVLDFYEKSGFSLSPEFKDLPDHLGVELELMHHLTLREADSRKKDDIDEVRKCMELQKEFLEEHLIKWVPGYCKKVEKYARHPFYSFLARLTQAFVEMEHKALRTDGGAT